jgi:hypothetical protein
LIKVSPSKGLVRKQIAPAFSAGANTFNGKSRDENERDTMSLGEQEGLQFDTAHCWHLDICDHARRAVQLGAPQELFGRRKCMDDVPKRPHEIVDRGANGSIIVDDRDHWRFGKSGFP